ncbi:MAG: 50S ribosomal protein L29 [Candidatus Aenigmatarchaeota archaeon]
MAILKSKKVRELNDKEMSEKLRELRLEFSKEMASSEIGGSVKNPGRIREIRRAIARIKTESGSRQKKVADSKRRGG